MRCPTSKKRLEIRTWHMSWCRKIKSQQRVNEGGWIEYGSSPLIDTNPGSVKGDEHLNLPSPRLQVRGFDRMTAKEAYQAFIWVTQRGQEWNGGIGHPLSIGPSCSDGLLARQCGRYCEIVEWTHGEPVREDCDYFVTEVKSRREQFNSSQDFIRDGALYSLAYLWIKPLTNNVVYRSS